MKPPVISVIIPCYNQAAFLPEAVESVAQQTYGQWECLIVNDGSTDETENVSMALCKADKRIYYIKKQNGGLSSARNIGLEVARGEYIQFLDADDKIAPDKFSASLGTDRIADVSISNFDFFTTSGEKIFPSFKLSNEQFDFHSILTGWDEQFVIPIHCSLFKASLFKSLRFNETLKAREDWVMWLQLFLQSDLQTVYIDQPLAHYRLSVGSMSQKKRLMNESLLAAYRVVYSFLPEAYKELFFNLAMDRAGSMLAEVESQLQKTRLSSSYQLGNFFVRNLNKIKRISSR